MHTLSASSSSILYIFSKKRPNNITFVIEIFTPTQAQFISFQLNILNYFCIQQFFFNYANTLYS